MKKRTSLLLLAGMAAISAAVTAPASAADVGVSISVGQPGFYGNIDIGNVPPPQVVYRQPVMIQPAPVGMAPVYLRVPPGQYKHWNRYCGRYDACGRPVYFVRDNWYRNVYVPRYREQHRERDQREWHGHDDRHDHDHVRGRH